VAFLEAAQEVEIERRGDSLVIRPVQARSLAGVVDAFAAFPEGFMAEGREFHAQKPRKWE
jgi:antitoxin VapB